MTNFTFRLIMETNGEVKGLGEKNIASPEQEGSPNPSNPTMPKNGIKNIAGLATVGYLSKQGLGYATSRIEMFTGSTQKQQAVNSVLKGIGYATAMIANPALGLASLAFDGITGLIITLK